MKILIFSGTSDGRELSYALSEKGHDVTVSVASEYGTEEQGSVAKISILSGAMPPEIMLERFRSVDLVVDATHPYAAHITASIRRAAEKTGTPRLRLLRAESRLPQDSVIVESAAKAAEYLLNKDGNILISTGAKELSVWEQHDRTRLFPRVLPSVKSIESCESLNIPHRNIIAMQGPFSTEMNCAVIHQYDIKWMVTKDGGAPGGFAEKARAAELCGIGLVVIARPEDEGLDFDTVLEKTAALAAALSRSV